MATKVLIDTNILIYAFMQNSPFYSKCREFLENLAKDEEVEINITEKSIFEMVAVFSSQAVSSKELNSDKIQNFVIYLTQNESFKILYSNHLTTKTALQLFFNSQPKERNLRLSFDSHCHRKSN